MANKTKMTANAAIFVFVFLLLFSIPNSRANNIVDAPIPNYLAVVIKRTQKEIQRINKAFDNSKSNNTIIYKNSKSFIRNNTANKINVANKDSKKNLINTTIVNPLDLPTLTNNVNLEKGEEEKGDSPLFFFFIFLDYILVHSILFLTLSVVNFIYILLTFKK